MYRKILAATDFSSPSRRALETATELARKSRASLVIAHVLPSVGPIGSEGWVPPKMYEEMEAAVRKSAQRRLDAAVERARRRRVRVKGLLLSGMPQDVLARTARRERADLVVIGTHGRTGLSRLLMGSVAARVIGTAPCPVLTVRGR
jgi:nucleotide-binding universal stress UspA family protein